MKNSRSVLVHLLLIMVLQPTGRPTGGWRRQSLKTGAASGPCVNDRKKGINVHEVQRWEKWTVDSTGSRPGLNRRLDSVERFLGHSGHGHPDDGYCRLVPDQCPVGNFDLQDRRRDSGRHHRPARGPRDTWP